MRPSVEARSLTKSAGPARAERGDRWRGARRRRVGASTWRILLLVGSCCCGSASAAETLIGVGDIWRYFKGTTEPSDPVAAWRQIGFQDGGWLSGPTGIGFGDDDDATVLTDMREGYVSVYMRRTFQVVSPASVTALELTMDYDDGFVAYLNGVEIARRGLVGNPVAYDATSASREAGTPETFDLAPGLLVAGTNVLAMQVHNFSLTSSDLSAIPELVANPGQTLIRYAFSGPTDIGRNSSATLTLLGSADFDMAAYAAVVVYDTELLDCVGQSFASSAWTDADFRSVDSSSPGRVVIGVVEDTTNSGNFVARGSDRAFVSLLFDASACTGTATVGFGSDPTDNVIVDVNAVGHDVASIHRVPATVRIVASGTFVRGNANNTPVDITSAVAVDETVTLADASFILHDQFGDGPEPPCLDAADANNDGVYDIMDSITILQYIFNNTQVVIAEPRAEIGSDTGASLGCLTPPAALGCD